MNTLKAYGHRLWCLLAHRRHWTYLDSPHGLPGLSHHTCTRCGEVYFGGR